MAKRILILVGIPNFDYSNEKSAVCSFLHTVKSAVESKGHIAHFPDLDKNAPRNNTSQKPSVKGKVIEQSKGLLKNFRWLYHSMSMRTYLKEHDNLLQQLLKGERYDQIIEFYTVGSIIGKTLAETWSCKLSVVFDAPVDEQFLEMKGTKTYHWKEIQLREKTTLIIADKIMVYSSACEAYIKRQYQIDSEYGVLPCVVFKESVVNDPVEGNFNILFIGSFLSWHKVEILVSVFKKLVSAIPNARLQLVGYGVEWERVNQLVKKEGLESMVEMPGFVAESELLAYKKNCHVAVMPGSNWYGSPLKLFEYAQSGIPFVAPETPTVQSIFEANTHCRFIDECNESSSLYEQLVYLFENPVERAEMAQNAKRFINENYGEKKYAVKLSEILL